MQGPRRLRQLLAQRNPLLVAGAHDGLSSILVRRAGFDAVWSSGFEISVSQGVPDANILTMTENLRAAAQMVQSSGLPVIADCDNGFGNAINTIHAVRAFEREGVAAICIEDNDFPKRCSFYVGVKRQLASAEEHVRKIQACLDTRSDDDLVVIARTEALVCGLGMEEALRRTRLYADAGADLILVHSKSPEPDEVLAFADQWDRETPLVCVPTTYSNAPASVLAEAGYRVVIFANQGLRSAIRATQEAFRRILEEQRAGAADEMMVGLKEVEDLIGVSTLMEHEQSYLPRDDSGLRAVVLAAGASPELGELTAEIPKAMLDIRGKPLLSRQVEALRTVGARDVSVVVGWCKERVDLPGLRRYEIDRSQGEVASLMRAEPELVGPVLVLYGDILFDTDLAARLLEAQGDVVLVVDRADSTRKARDLVHTEPPGEERGRRLRGHRTHSVYRIGAGLERANGEWIGLMLLREAGAAALRRVYQEAAALGAERPFYEAASLDEAALPDLLQAMIDAGVDVRCIDTYQGWLEINSFEDYRRAWAQVS
jgi:phosphoenolpyruvate phosphomutase